MRASSPSSVALLLLSLVLALLAGLQWSTPVSAQGLCGGTLANPGACTPANNNVAPSASAKAALSKYTQIVHIYLTANSFDFLFGAYPGANNIQRALSSGLYHPQLTEAGYTGNLTNGATQNYTCLPCDTVGYITATTSPFNSSYCTVAGQAAGFCIPNVPFEASPYIPINKTWPTDPKHTFYATQYNDNGGAMNGFVWASGKAGAFGLAYYNLTGSYLFQLAQDYTLFDNFFQSAYGGVMVNHLYLVGAQIPTWNTTANPVCPQYIFQNYTINGASVVTNTTNLYPYNWADSYGNYLPANDASLFTPDCHMVENIDPFTLGKSPNMRPLTHTHIGNLLTAANVSWTYYYQSWNLTKASPVGVKTTAPVSLHENPFTFFQDFANFSSPYVMSHIRDDDQFYSDLANGVLANVTWVKPDQSDGFGVTDNNPAIGMVKLQSYMDAIYASSYWQNQQMMVILSFSDSDGLYDHVPPYTGDGYGPGDRVPTVVISPDTIGGKINSQPYETGSWLKMLGTRFGLPTDSLFNAARLQSTRDFSNIFTDPVTYSQQTAAPTLANGTAQVRWGYSLQCPNNTLDYPCLTQLVGTATVNTTLLNSTYSGTPYAYYQMLSFTGTRTYTNRYGAQVVTSASLAPVNELNSNLNRLVLTATALGAGTPTFRLGSVIQFPGGLLGNEVELIVTTGYPIESITINASSTNSLNDDPSHVYICSTAPGFVPSAFNASNDAPVFFNAMGPCTDPAPFAFQQQSANNTAAGLRTYAFSYSITDNATFAAQVNAQLSTDGTVNFDALGNVYYNIITISGTRSEQSLVNLSASSTVTISSLMAPNVIATSNLAYITNNNRIYPQYPFLDRYGLAYTVTSSVGKVVAGSELSDGALYSSSNVVGAYIYRLDTLDEQGLAGNWGYPAFNMYNSNQNQLTLTLLPNPPVYQLVTFCYVLYGSPQTLDYPFSVVTKGTALINNTLVNVTGQSYTGVALPSYYMLGFVGTRTFTNRFGAQVVMAMTLAAPGEDYNANYQSPVSPYATYGGIAFHLNGTFEAQGGLPMTDLSIFQDPYPVEGTAYGAGVASGANTLNNDPSRTLFVSNMPGFVNSTYSDANTATQVGTVAGTSDLSQCKAAVTPVQLSSADTAPGMRVYALNYSVTGSAGYSTIAALQLVTDGTVQQDGLGNNYYTIAAASGVRLYFAPNGTLLSNTTVTAVLPVCSGPSVSNLDAVYCNNNRLYPQYPYVDRLGLAFQLSAPVPSVGAAGLSSTSVNQVGILMYRSTEFNEIRYASGGTPAFQAYASNYTSANFTLSLTPAPAAVAASYQAVQWGYIMYCASYSLSYPCAVQVSGTAIVTGSPMTQTGTSSTYGPLSGQQAYLVVGFSGTRTFYDQYGEVFTSNMALQPLKEDYADNLLYLTAPYADGDGPTFRLNGTDGSLTEVLGGSLTNEINVFQNTPSTYVTEGIAVSGSGSSALVYNYTRTIFCSTLPGFVASAANATSQTPAGATNMSACALPSAFKNTFPKLSATLQGVPYTFGYSLSDGATFTVQAVVTITTDGRVYQDAIGNRYVLAVQANGTRTYYDWTVASTSSSAPTATTVITGLVPVGNATTGTLTYTGNKNSNRLYPSASPHVDVLGLSFTTATPAPVTGNSSLLEAIVSIVSYKDNVLEETQTGGKYPLQQYQATAISATATSNLSGLPAVTRPSSTPPSTTAGSSSSAVAAGSSSNAAGAASTAASAAATSAARGSSSATSAPAVTSAATSAARVGSSSATSASAASTAASATSAPAAATSAPVASSSTGAPAVVTSGGGGGGSGLSGGQIAGIVVGSVVGGLLLLCLCVAALWAALGGKEKQRPVPESESSKNISTLPTREPSQMGTVEMQPQMRNGHVTEPVEV